MNHEKKSKVFVAMNTKKLLGILKEAFAQKEQEELEQMRRIMKEPDRMERWKKIAKATYDPEFMERRRREVM